MGDVIPSQDRASDIGAERFLVKEGLEILAAYRALKDATVRHAFKASVVAESTRQNFPLPRPRDAAHPAPRAGFRSDGRNAKGPSLTNLIPFEDRRPDRAKAADDQDMDTDTFLIAEGLELLAAYRSIPDKAVRQALMTSVVALAGALRQRIED